MPRRTRRLLVAPLCAALLVPAAVAPAAEAAKLKLGYYDCYGYDYSSGFLMYKGSVKLKPRKRYEHSFGRDGREMTDKTKGRYKIKGKKVKFKGGAMQHTPGRITGKKEFDVWVDGRASGISCTHDATP